MISFAQAQDFVTHCLHDQPAGELPVAQLVNEAGDLMVASHPWQWLKRTNKLLSITASQEFIRLPTDLAEVLSTAYVADTVRSFNWTTVDGLNTLIASGLSTDGDLWGALVYKEDEPDQSVIRVWPTPSEDVTDALSIMYRAKWRRITGNLPEEALRMPEWMESLYWRYLRAVSKGHEEDHATSLDQELMVIAQGLVFAYARRMDAHAQPILGPIENGALRGRRIGQRSWQLANPVPPPSVL